MGNFLFQIASAIGYAKRHGMGFTVPTTTKDPKWNPIYLQHLARPNYKPSLPLIKVVERGHAYQEIPFKEGWRSGNIQLDGYWQSEKYFKEFRNSILDAFAFDYMKSPGVVAVHVRRGDYVKLAHKHPPLDPSWYNAAMDKFRESIPDVSFMFFSDDIPYCKANWGGLKDCFFSEGQSEQEDLEEMACCEHQICSASTFAWWGAWLNRNPEKIVIMPKRWFSVAEDAKCNTKDIVPEEWLRL